MAQGKLIELPDRPGAAFGGLEIGAIADGFQSADAFAVELLIAQRFVVAGAVANAQPAVTRKLGKVSEACRVLDIGDQEMRADQAHAGSSRAGVRSPGTGGRSGTSAGGTGIGWRALDPTVHRGAAPGNGVCRAAVSLTSRGGRSWQRRCCRRGRVPNVGRGI